MSFQGDSLCLIQLESPIASLYLTHEKVSLKFALNNDDEEDVRKLYWVIWHQL